MSYKSSIIEATKFKLRQALQKLRFLFINGKKTQQIYAITHKFWQIVKKLSKISKAHAEAYKNLNC